MGYLQTKTHESLGLTKLKTDSPKLFEPTSESIVTNN